MSWIITGICVIVIIILFILLNKKQYIDKTELTNYQNELKDLRKEEKRVSEKLTSAEEKYNSVIKEYNKINSNYRQELEESFKQERIQRQQLLDEEFEQQKVERQNNLNSRMELITKQIQEQVNKAEISARAEIEHWTQARQEAEEVAALQEKKFQAVLAPLQQYEKEKQERLYYTIQVPDEYKDDIEFLLTTVSQKVQHPDIINKLVWAEYVKPYIDETFKRVGIDDKPGIYKLTSLQTGKCYIGKSTNIKKRISDHIKSAIGITSIADQAVHHAIADEGYWNWAIEPVIYCEKEQLNEMEKYYIEFFKSQEFGYNKNSGGGG